MKKRNTKTVAATPTDASRLADQQTLERQRKRSARVLLKRRRAKSGQ